MGHGKITRTVIVTILMIGLSTNLSQATDLFQSDNDVLIVEENLIIKRDTSINKNILITNGATLVVSSGITLTTNGTLRVDGNGTLIIGGALIGLSRKGKLVLADGTISLNPGSLVKWNGDFSRSDDRSNFIIDGTFIVRGDSTNYSSIKGFGMIIQPKDQWNQSFASFNEKLDPFTVLNNH